jgi:hypothetical protein
VFRVVNDERCTNIGFNFNTRNRSGWFSKEILIRIIIADLAKPGKALLIP